MSALNRVMQLQAKFDFLKSEQADHYEKRTEIELRVQTCERAQKVIQTVAEMTQSELQFRIGELVTLALDSVMDDPYGFEIEFVQRRGRTECDIYFVRDGFKVDPLEETGGGAVDIAALALRISLYTLANPRPRPFFPLDEPFHWLKGNDMPKKAAQMLKRLSEELGLQILTVSHVDEIIDDADRNFLVSRVRTKKPYSTIEVITND